VILLLTFFLVFEYGLGSIPVSNILYYFILFQNANKKGVGLKIKIRKGIKTNIFFLLFIIWATTSTIIYNLSYVNFSTRSAIQFLFTLQYFIFIIEFNINIEKFEKWLYRFSLILALGMIFLFILLHQYSNIAFLYSSGRGWANGYIPGWPSSVPIPLLFGLWLNIKKKKSKIFGLIIVMALLLTTSRGAMLGIVAIISYFQFKKMKTNKLKWFFVITPIVVVILIFGYDTLMLIYQLVPSMEHRMGLSYDRVDILYTTFRYVSLRPLLGFGGNTIDQIIVTYGNFSKLGVNWEQTHNWILEMTLRYGVVGSVLFIGFMISILLRIQEKDKRFMFLLLLILGLFQDFMRNFSIVFLMMYLTIDLKSTIEHELQRFRLGNKGKT